MSNNKLPYHNMSSFETHNEFNLFLLEINKCSIADLLNKCKCLYIPAKDKLIKHN